MALVFDAIAALAGGSTDTAGPLYPVSMLAILIGIVLMATQWHRAGVLPRWTGPTLAVGWFLGASPVLGFRGSMLILAAAFLAVAVGLHRRAPASLTTPAELNSAVAA